MVKNLPANAGDARDMGSIPGWGRSLGIGNVNLFQYSCLENSMDSGAWQATVHGVATHQAPLFMGFSRQEYWSGVPLPSPNIY